MIFVSVSELIDDEDDDESFNSIADVSLMIVAGFVVVVMVDIFSLGEDAPSF